MKKLLLLFTVAILATMGVNAQDHYIRVSIEPGAVLNTKMDKKFALGGSVAWMMEDEFISGNDNNLISVTLKGMNNPFLDGKLISSMFNKEYDAFNYIMPLVGYRFAQDGIDDGFFIEPRIGVAVLAGGKANFVIAPQAGYTYENFDFGVFCDMGFGGKPNAIKTNNFFTLGATIAYNIEL